mgnify:CR=1 FL=1
MKKTLSYKEKKRAFNALKSPSMASFDLELLKKLCPEHPELSRFMLKPSRCADDILFFLLDFATAEEIRQNRIHKEGAMGNTNVETRAEEAEQRAEEAESRAEEAEERAEDAEQRAEELEKALEDEKKKEA